ncbi:MAG TPA: hypothetical protein VFU44_05670 [Candidatus Limnocylindria bacterium]|nr:hypothetical protein [Candidatus Limnocylindria bacterium]
MRVIRPQSLVPGARRRSILLAASMLAVGLLAIELAALGVSSTAAAALMGATAALGLGVGSAWLMRAVRPDRSRAMAEALTSLLTNVFDDTYTLIVTPLLPVRDQARLDGILVGPGGIRVLTARDWEGRYRLRGRTWEFDARGRRGWIRCRTNPTFDAIALCDAVVRWAKEAGLPDVAIQPAVAFPRSHSRIVLEEPDGEVITTENAPWWANTIGRVRRVDPATSARVLEAVLDAAERATHMRPAVVSGQPR